MKGKFMIIAALLGALTFGACVDSEESASVTAVRNAKAEQLKSVATLNNAKAQAEAQIAAAQAQIAAAQAQLLQAQATKAAAEAAAKNAETEAQKIANEQAAIQAEIDAANAEAEIARIEAQLELDLLTYQTNLLAAQLNFNKAMQGLAAQEKENLETIYLAYNAALAEVVSLQEAIFENELDIAELEAEIAELDADAEWEDVVEAATKAVADAQKKVADTESKLAAKKAAYEKIESMGGINYAELKKEIEAATKALEAANKNYAYAVKNTATKREAKTENSNAISNSLYAQSYFDVLRKYNEYIGPMVVNNDGTLATTDGSSPIIVRNSTMAHDEEGKVIGWGYCKATLNNNGEYVMPSNGEVFPLYGPVLTDTIEAELDDDTVIGESYCVGYRNLFAENLDALSAEHEKVISTSPWATNLDIAQKKLAAWEKAAEYDVLVSVYNTYLKNKADIQALINDKQAKINANNRMIAIYQATGFGGTKEEYADEIAGLEADNDKLYIEINGKVSTNTKGLIQEQDDLFAKLKKDLSNKYATEGAINAVISEYEGLVAAVEVAQEIYDDVLTWELTKILLNAELKEDYAEHAALIANEVVLAQAVLDARVAENEAHEAYEEANEYLGELNALWTVLAAAPAGSVEDMMNEELQALAAEIATLEANLKAQKTALADAQADLAEIEAMTEEEIAEAKEEIIDELIEELEELIEDLEEANELLEQELTVAVIAAENWTEILEDALGEDFDEDEE